MSAFDPTKPFRTRSGTIVHMKITDGRGACKYWGYIGTNYTLEGWTEEGRYLTAANTEHELDLVNVKPWTLPAPPEGMQWHRDDWTEDMLPEGWRPLLSKEVMQDGDQYGDCYMMPNGSAPKEWKSFKGLLATSSHMRTKRPLPTPPKKVPLTFEYVSGFVGVEFRSARTKNQYCPQVVGQDGVALFVVGYMTWEDLQKKNVEWRSVQSPEWKPCEMEEKA